MSEKDASQNHQERDAILREELERRLDFLEKAEESKFGDFTTTDWAVCVLLFFIVPLIILGVVGP